MILNIIRFGSEQAPALFGDQLPAVTKIMCRVCIDGHTPRAPKDPCIIQAMDTLFEPDGRRQGRLYSWQARIVHHRTGKIVDRQRGQPPMWITLKRQPTI